MIHDSDAEWHPPGADDQGFVSLYKLRKDARAIDREAFAAAHPRPALVADITDEDVAAAADDGDTDSGVHLLTRVYPRAGVLRYLNRIAFLCKRPGNPFAHLIAVGRSHTNDIVFAIDTISKVHGTFVREGERWQYTDRQSTNGSWLNDKRLEPGGSAVLEDGDELRLGVEATIRFLLPPSLYTYINGL